MSTLLFISLLAMDALVTEPATGKDFPPAVRVGNDVVPITGADYRSVSGVMVYAIAHYGAVDATPSPVTPSAEARWHWVESQAPKAFMLRGTRDVPARGIRYSWRTSLKKVGYKGTNDDTFTNAFRKDFSAESELLISADGEGCLRVEQDGELLGQWEDPELVQAVWAVSLGRHSEVRHPERLVTREHLGHPPLAAAELKGESPQSRS